MILIIAHHYAVHGFAQERMPYSFNRHFVGFLSLGGQLGVVCFILISGYFMCKSKVTLYKILKLLGEVWFYSVTIGLIFLFFLPDYAEMGVMQLIRMCLPVGCSNYWFITTYLLLLIASPLLNIIIEKLSKKELLKVIFLFIIIWSVMPSITIAQYGFNELGWFIVIYLIAAYIRNYTESCHINGRKCFLIAACCYGLVILSNVLLIIVSCITDNLFIAKQSIRFSEINSPLILLTAIPLFIGIIKLPPRNNKVINTLAGTILGVYLIHDNEFIRPFLWYSVFKNSQFSESNYLIIHAVTAIALVFLGCVVIDLIRQITVEKYYEKFLNKNLAAIQKKINNTVDRVFNFIN